jgi:hypothetical protein
VSNTKETQKEVKAEKTKAAPSSARKKLDAAINVDFTRNHAGGNNGQREIIKRKKLLPPHNYRLFKEKTYQC